MKHLCKYFKNISNSKNKTKSFQKRDNRLIGDQFMKEQSLCEWTENDKLLFMNIH